MKMSQSRAAFGECFGARTINTTVVESAGGHRCRLFEEREKSWTGVFFFEPLRTCSRLLKTLLTPLLQCRAARIHVRTFNYEQGRSHNRSVFLNEL